MDCFERCAYHVTGTQLLDRRCTCLGTEGCVLLGFVPIGDSTGG